MSTCMENVFQTRTRGDHFNFRILAGTQFIWGEQNVTCKYLPTRRNGGRVCQRDCKGWGTRDDGFQFVNSNIQRASRLKRKRISTAISIRFHPMISLLFLPLLDLYLRLLIWFDRFSGSCIIEKWDKSWRQKGRSICGNRLIELLFSPFFSGFFLHVFWEISEVSQKIIDAFMFFIYIAFMFTFILDIIFSMELGGNYVCFTNYKSLISRSSFSGLLSSTWWSESFIRIFLFSFLYLFTKELKVQVQIAVIKKKKLIF